jgi:hypothetical protein
MAGVGASMTGHGSALWRGERGEGGGGEGGMAWGQHGACHGGLQEWGRAMALSVLPPWLL